MAGTSYQDWAITGLFYAAIHYVEAYLAIKKIHSTDHRARDSDIHTDANLRPIYRAYSELKNQSTKARYMLGRFGAQDVADLQQELDSIKARVLPLLGRSA